VERLPSKCEAQSSNPSTTIKKKKKKINYIVLSPSPYTLEWGLRNLGSNSDLNLEQIKRPWFYFYISIRTLSK
jgi:hypothetical protein